MTRILLKGGCVLTLGARSQNLPLGDVLIEDDRVVEVGTTLRARDAEQVDASDTIVMPGFVDSHRHVWTSLFRNLGDGDPRTAVRAPAWVVGDHYGAEDVYAATLVGLLGAAAAGITTVVDWSHLPVEGGLAEAALRAHADAGLRTVYVHAHGARSAASDLTAAVAALRAAAGPRTTLAFGSVVPGAGDPDGLEQQWAAARDLGLRIHAHASDGAAPGHLARAAERGLLRDDVTLVHHTAVDAADLDAISSSGAAISLAPSSEMAAGLGSPPIQRLIDRDVRPGLGVEDERVAPGDLFAQMRATISVQHATVFDRKLAGKAGLPKLMSTRDVIRFATVDGARVAGLRGATGSIEPGMRADLILLRTDRPNIFPINDPIGAVVWGMDTSNVDRVLVDGREVVRGGELDADVERVRALAAEARARVAGAAGLLTTSAAGGRA
jgi:cytosine/adenosine deaminase-related metal-dependent hydrolase